MINADVFSGVDSEVHGLGAGTRKYRRTASSVAWSEGAIRKWANKDAGAAAVIDVVVEGDVDLFAQQEGGNFLLGGKLEVIHTIFTVMVFYRNVKLTQGGRLISSGDGKTDFIHYGITAIDGEEGIAEAVAGINRRTTGSVTRGRCTIGIRPGEDTHATRLIDRIFKSELHALSVGEGCRARCW